MDSSQSPDFSSEKKAHLLCKEDPNTCRETHTKGHLTGPSFQVEELDSCKNLQVCDEVIVTTDTETSISAVISSSLQAVNGDYSTEVIDSEELDSRLASDVSEDGDNCEPGEDGCELGCIAKEDCVLQEKECPVEADGEPATTMADDDRTGVAELSSTAEHWCDLVQQKTQDEEGNDAPPQGPQPVALPSGFPSAFVPPTSSQLHTPLPPSQNTNNSNSCDPVINPSPPVPPVAMAMSGGEPPRKRAKITKHGQIEITLEGKNLWDEFYRRGTEMIVNRLGRRMFPGFAVVVNGLKPKAKYSMKVEMILADNHRFKFLNGRWLAVGNAEPQSLSETYIHPDSPNSGAFWMRHGVSFRKLKITNNKERPGNNALIHSMHKYYLRLLIDEEFKTPPGGQKIPAKNVLQMEFPETSFIAVTAYQNEEVTQLKITNNPFAKAFRENAAEMDWDVLYHHNGMYSPVPTHPEMYGNHHLMHPGMWPLQSPMLPPTPLTATLPPYSPLTGVTPNQAGTSYHTPGQYHYSSTVTPTAFQGSSGSMPPGAGSYFQWPQINGQQRNNATGAATSQTLSMIAPPSSMSSGQLQHQDSFSDQFHHPTHHYTAASVHPPSSHQVAHGNSTLPDFDSAFSSSVRQS